MLMHSANSCDCTKASTMSSSFGSYRIILIRKQPLLITYSCCSSLNRRRKLLLECPDPLHNNDTFPHHLRCLRWLECFARQSKQSLSSAIWVRDDIQLLRRLNG